MVGKERAMSIPRREFIKLFGISLGSLLLARCQRAETPSPTVTCYEVVQLSPTPGATPPESLSARERLRLCWLLFGELAQKTRDAWDLKDADWGDDPIGRQMTANHRQALDGLVSAGEISTPVAGLIQEAYDAAVYHVWRSNAPITCYEPMMVDYAPASAGNLVNQSEILGQIAAGGTVDPETLSKARTALEHDLAFYSLTDADVQALYDRVLEEYRESNQTVPSFETLELTLTPDVKTAAQYLVDLLAEK
jgi:hypothetical protein